jgi:hypothetical protein
MIDRFRKWFHGGAGEQALCAPSLTTDNATEASKPLHVVPLPLNATEKIR